MKDILYLFLLILVTIVMIFIGVVLGTFLQAGLSLILPCEWVWVITVIFGIAWLAVTIGVVVFIIEM